MKLTPSPVKKIALAHNLPIFQPERLPEEKLMEFLDTTNPDVIIVVAYGLKIPPVILDFSPYGCINTHASLLPKYRGASPIQAVILNGEKITGITTMKMDEGWDTGDILLTRLVSIGDEENFGALHDRLAKIGATTLIETLSALEEGKIKPLPQKHSDATYVRKLTETDCLLDWTAPTISLFNRIRALDPLPGARTYLNGEILKIWSARLGDGWYGLEHAVPGTIGELEKGDKGGLPVRTSDGVLLITELQSPGKKRLNIHQFVAGSPLQAKMVFG
jgi:methionyl-tRNA formyltransferase